MARHRQRGSQSSALQALPRERRDRSGDVDVQLWTAARDVWRDDMPKLPRVPALRKRKSPSDIALHMPIFNAVANVRVPALENEDGPNIGGGGSDHCVQYGYTATSQ